MIISPTRRRVSHHSSPPALLIPSHPVSPGQRPGLLVRVGHLSLPVTRLWVPESRSWMLSCEFVGQAIGPHDRRMTLRLVYLLFCQALRWLVLLAREFGDQGRRTADAAPRGRGAAASGDPAADVQGPTERCWLGRLGCCPARAGTGCLSGLRRCCAGIKTWSDAAGAAGLPGGRVGAPPHLTGAVAPRPRVYNVGDLQPGDWCSTPTTWPTRRPSTTSASTSAPAT